MGAFAARDLRDVLRQTGDATKPRQATKSAPASRPGRGGAVGRGPSARSDLGPASRWHAAAGSRPPPLRPPALLVVAALFLASHLAYAEANKDGTDMFGTVERATRADVLDQLRPPNERGSKKALENPCGR